MRTLSAVVSLAALLTACGDSTAPPTGDPAPTASPDVGVTALLPAEPTASPVADPAAPTPVPPVDGEPGGAADWRKVASADDAFNLSRLDQAWRLGRAEAEDKGFATQVEALGPLVDPDAGQADRLQPPPGPYRCRTLKLGTKNETGSALVVYPFFRCSVELTPGGDLVLTKTTGSQRTRGLLYPDTDLRLVFVGAQAWGADEAGFPRYGQQLVRDQVGVLERIGANRWRMVVPFPRVDSTLEILELIR